MGAERQLTELEGAVLTEIALRGNDTAYKVRRAFELSPSTQWRGSAGAVSPAIRRLVEAGLIATSPHPTRQGQLLAVTAAGRRALVGWAKNVELACGAGLDPFRLRVGIWASLPPGEQARHYDDLERAILAEVAALDAEPKADQPHELQKELARELALSRLQWLRRQRGNNPGR